MKLYGIRIIMLKTKTKNLYHLYNKNILKKESKKKLKLKSKKNKKNLNRKVSKNYNYLWKNWIINSKWTDSK